MPQLRVALAQIDTTVGDLPGNTEAVVRWTRHAAGLGAHLVAFPRLTLTGLPPEGLASRRSFVVASRHALAQLAGRLDGDGLGTVAVAVGYLDGDPDGSHPRDACALLYGGAVVASRHQDHRLGGDAGDNSAAADRLPLARLHGVDVAMTIDADLSASGGPAALARDARVGLLVCLGGWPYQRRCADARLDLLRRRAGEAGATVACVNAVGGQDEWVFDGGSLVVSAGGDLLGRAPQFEEGCLLADLDPTSTAPGTDGAGDADADEADTQAVERVTLTDAPIDAYDPLAPSLAEPLGELAALYAALVTATRDYARKNGFASVLVGLSGGVDSALTATIGCDALGPEATYGVAMPSRHSSAHSVADAEELARRQRLRWAVVPIEPVTAAFESSLAPVGGAHGLAAENLQARIRGTVLMTLSNAAGHLVLATGNSTEGATGFATLYGDTAGGFAPLADVPKTLVWELARWRNRSAADRGERPPIPESSITKPPSAELAPGQLDADRLPPYDVLDPVLDGYVEQGRDRQQLIDDGFDAGLVDQVIRMVGGAEFKRRQYPPGPRISHRPAGRDRLPMTSHWARVAGLTRR
jgi:NAD+ synthase (glutamine-hydrolysing)